MTAVPPRQMGALLVRLEAVTSTIDRAREWLHEGASHGSVVIAERQTAGRGRRGRPWASPKGGLWMSVITRPGIEVEKAGLLGLAIAVAGAEATEATLGQAEACGTQTGTQAKAYGTQSGTQAEAYPYPQVGLKWPNDLMIGEKKVGGVLVDAQVEAGLVSEAILSIGINVNIRVEDLPQEIQASATSLLEVTGQAQSVEELAVRLLENLDNLWPSVKGDGTAILEAWRNRDTLIGKEVMVEEAGKMLAGRARGVDELGRLRLISNESDYVVSAGEVISVRGLWNEDSQVRAE